MLPYCRSTTSSLANIVENTVKTEIIETSARTSRITSFRIGGENTARKILQPLAQTIDHTRTGNSNVLAPVSIISVFTVGFWICTFYVLENDKADYSLLVPVSYSLSLTYPVPMSPLNRLTKYAILLSFVLSSLPYCFL